MTLNSRVIEIDLVAKHKSGELCCPAAALIINMVLLIILFVSIDPIDNVIIWLLCIFTKSKSNDKY